MMTLWQRIIRWLDERIGLTELVDTHLKGYRVPSEAGVFYTLGMVAVVAYAIQAVTGFVLLIYYIPHADYAFHGLQEIMRKAPFGWLFRMMHVVGSNMMVAVLFLHLFSVFFTGSYKKPRELTWLTGGLMLLFALLFCLSGYLLPWSQLSYWATTIVTAMPTAFPYLGEYVTRLLRGTEHVSGVTLNRFFALHVAILPPFLVSLMGLHVFLIRRTGISPSPFRRSEGQAGGYPLYPHFLLKGLFMVMVYLAVMFFIISFMPTLFLPAEANVPADPYKTPAHIKPGWYFLAPYQMLKLIPNKFLGIFIELLLLGVFLLWPFLDTKEERNIMRRPLLLGVFLLTLTLWILLTLWGKYS